MTETRDAFLHEDLSDVRPSTRSEMSGEIAMGADLVSSWFRLSKHIKMYGKENENGTYKCFGGLQNKFPLL